jgi:hypothetical protein
MEAADKEQDQYEQHQLRSWTNATNATNTISTSALTYGRAAVGVAAGGRLSPGGGDAKSEALKVLAMKRLGIDPPPTGIPAGVPVSGVPIAAPVPFSHDGVAAIRAAPVLSGYQVYMRTEVPLAKARNPAMEHKDAFSATGKAWKQLPPTEVEKWKAKAGEANIRTASTDAASLALERAMPSPPSDGQTLVGGPTGASRSDPASTESYIIL